MATYRKRKRNVVTAFTFEDLETYGREHTKHDINQPLWGFDLCGHWIERQNCQLFYVSTKLGGYVPFRPWNVLVLPTHEGEDITLWDYSLFLKSYEEVEDDL